jgi:DNA-binding beta-propeller fold protein YncE
VIRHENAAAKANGNDADGVIGWQSLTRTSGATPGTTLSSPRGIAIDSVSGKVFVADRNNNRVLRFANSRALETGDEPEAVLGQDNFGNSTEGTSATRMSSPTGLALDSGGRLWVADSRNNRILRFNNAPTLPSGAAASAVLGQPNFTSSTPGTSATTFDYPYGICIHQSFGNPTSLWVADYRNARVLRFDNPGTLANGAAAAGVLGQTNFTSNTAALTAHGMELPSGVCVDLSGRLWVSDEGHDRVLRFGNAAAKANGAAADGVLLAPNFTTRGTQGSNPIGISISLGGRLFVPFYTSGGVVWFDSAHTKANGAAPDGSLGSQSGVAPDGPEVIGEAGGSAVDPNTSRLWVTHNSGRVSRFTPSIESRIVSARFNAQGRFELQMLIRADERIELRSGTDLLSWPTLDATPFNFTTATPFASQTWTAPAAPAGPERFYRLQLK